MQKILQLFVAKGDSENVWMYIQKLNGERVKRTLFGGFWRVRADIKMNKYTGEYARVCINGAWRCMGMHGDAWRCDEAVGGCRRLLECPLKALGSSRSDDRHTVGMIPYTNIRSSIVGHPRAFRTDQTHRGPPQNLNQNQDLQRSWQPLQKNSLGLIRITSTRTPPLRPSAPTRRRPSTPPPHRTAAPPRRHAITHPHFRASMSWYRHAVASSLEG